MEKTGQMRFTPPVQTMYALRQAIDEYLFATNEKLAWDTFPEVAKVTPGPSMAIDCAQPDKIIPDNKIKIIFFIP